MPLPADGSKVKLGKGSLLLDQQDSSGDPTGLKFVGNVTALEIAADVTKAQLFSSTQRSAPLIAEAVTRVAYTLTATLSEYQIENLKKFLLGTSSSRTQSLALAQVANFSGGEVVAGGYIDVGARQITNVTATRDGSIALVAGTDYILYSEFGLLKLIDGGAVQDGDDIAVTFDQPLLMIDTIAIAQDSSPICHLLYLADDANQDADGARDRLEVWKVSVAPEGSLNLISDEYGSFQLTMAIVDDSDNHPTSPFGNLERVRG